MTLPEFDLAGPAGRAFQSIAEVWGMTDAEQMAVLAINDPVLLATIKEGDADCPPGETLCRISHILGIFEAINMLLPVPERADAWIRKPNKAPLFAGRSALQLITSGHLSDLAKVHRYLAAEACG